MTSGRDHGGPSPRPVPLAELQSLLGPTEALVSYLVGAEESFLFAIRRDRAAMYRLGLGSKALAERVRSLRARLDAEGVESLADIRPFPVTRAHALYRELLGPAEALLEGVEHLMVVPEAALQSLPFSVLVTEAPAREPRTLTEHRDVAWLVRRYALTTLPSVGSLRALRRFAKAGREGEPFAGFGDPQLEGEGGGARGIRVAALFARGAVADVGAVRRLPPLPDTAEELEAAAAALHARGGSVFLRERATERRVKSMDLARFDTVAFSTHGLLAGEFRGLAEPALVLTPPARGTALDDGLLTASEVARLRLNAQWVLLSACNTAGPDGRPGAQGLSGLSRSFFYAGARALLVSHWAVSSQATVALVTGAFRELAADPGAGRAEAMRRSMLALMAERDRPYLAHPMFWAPFVVVGEGGAEAQVGAHLEAAGGVAGKAARSFLERITKTRPAPAEDADERR